MCIRGLEMLVLHKLLYKYYMDDPKTKSESVTIRSPIGKLLSES